MIPELPSEKLIHESAREWTDPTADETVRTERVFYPDGRLAGHREMRSRSGRPDLLMAVSRHGLPPWLALILAILPGPAALGLAYAVQQNATAALVSGLLLVALVGVDGLIALTILGALQLCVWVAITGTGWVGEGDAYVLAVLISLLVMAPAMRLRR